MTLSPALQRAIIALFFAILVGVYAVAWLGPALGLYHDDAVYLVTAKALVAGHGYTIDSLPAPIPQTKYPPVFPALLALFVLVSEQPQWLKILPLACTVGWLAMTRKLLLRMGASENGAMLLIGLTAASPMVVYLSTSLLSETLFALLVTATLYSLLDDRPGLAGLLAGLSMLTRAAGAPLIVACILTLALRARFRGAVVFTISAMLLVAPWLGWSIAHAPQDDYYGVGNYANLNILTSHLQLNEKAAVFGMNVVFLFSTPFVLLTGFTNMLSFFSTVAAFLWSLVVRRQLVPDLFLLLYSGLLLCWAGPPVRFVAPILPLVLWVVWRAVQQIELREAVIAVAMIAALVPLVSDIRRIPEAIRGGLFPANVRVSDDWGDMQKLFAAIRTSTPADAILLANLDPVFYLNTGRKAVRGFAPDGYRVFYSPNGTAITPDEMARAVSRTHATYVALTPDRDFSESPSFHKAVEALERGGVLVPVAVPGANPEYRLLQVVR